MDAAIVQWYGKWFGSIRLDANEEAVDRHCDNEAWKRRRISSTRFPMLWHFTATRQGYGDQKVTTPTQLDKSILQ